jgi:hypothetical protein
MGLDARVFCDCYSKKKIKPFALPEYISFNPVDGLVLDMKEESLTKAESAAYSKWRKSSLCEHERTHAVYFRLGNIALIAFIREFLQSQENQYSILLSQVVYNGVHGGDHIPADQIPDLMKEVVQLENDQKPLK